MPHFSRPCARDCGSAGQPWRSCSTPAAASEIKYIVNNVPITSYDIQRRAAFMKLQRRKGNLNALPKTR